MVSNKKIIKKLNSVEKEYQKIQAMYYFKVEKMSCDHVSQKTGLSKSHIYYLSHVLKNKGLAGLCFTTQKDKTINF